MCHIFHPAQNICHIFHPAKNICHNVTYICPKKNAASSLSLLLSHLYWGCESEFPENHRPSIAPNFFAKRPFLMGLGALQSSWACLDNGTGPSS